MPNSTLLLWTYNNLHANLIKCREETVSTDKKLEILMLSIADMCSALAFATEDDRLAAELSQQHDSWRTP